MQTWISWKKEMQKYFLLYPLSYPSFDLSLYKQFLDFSIPLYLSYFNSLSLYIQSVSFFFCFNLPHSTFSKVYWKISDLLICLEWMSNLRIFIINERLILIEILNYLHWFLVLYSIRPQAYWYHSLKILEVLMQNMRPTCVEVFFSWCQPKTIQMVL